MEDYINKEKTKTSKIDALFESVEDITGIKKDVILSKKRKQDVAMARNIVGYILHKGVGMTTTSVAKALNRDHSTIVYYNRMFDTNYNYYKEYRVIYNLVTELFWSKFFTEEKEEIDLQVKSLQSLIEKLNERTEYLLIKNH